MIKDISIVISVYDAAPYIEETINSLKHLDSVEILVLDNNSSDESLRVIENTIKNSNIKLYANKKQKDIFQNYDFLAKKTNNDYLYILGADDYIISGECGGDKSSTCSYGFPVTNYFKDGTDQVYKTYPSKEWAFALSKQVSKDKVIKFQLKYADHDVHVLGVHNKKNFIKHLGKLKSDCVEGLSFWLVLCNLLTAQKNGAAPVRIEKSFVLFKRTDNKYKSGTHASDSNHNIQPTKMSEKISKYLRRNLSSLQNAAYIIFEFNLNPISSLRLLCAPRRFGDDARIFSFGPILNIPYGFLNLFKFLMRKISN
jgi:glycosyltransferase involved in cell wall biosynthesis